MSFLAFFYILAHIAFILFRLPHFIITLILCLSLTVTLFADDTVVILRSQELSAYDMAIDGFVKECKLKNIDVKSIEDMRGKLTNGRKVIAKYTNSDKKPDLFLAVGVLAATLAKKSIKDTPVIFCMVVNYRRFNLSAPNITGIASEVSEEKVINIYKQAIGQLNSVGVIYDPFKTKEMIASGRKYFSAIGTELKGVGVKSSGQVKNALAKIIDDIDALWLVPDSTVISRESFRTLYNGALKKRVPILSTSDVFVKAGALIGVYPDYHNIGVEAGRMASMILGGVEFEPGYVRYPDKIDIGVNLETASKIKLKISKETYEQHHVVEFP